MVCEPYVVMPVESQVVVYVFREEVEVICEPMGVTPSRRNWTPATATLSVEEAERVMEEPATVEPLDGIVRETDGGVVSGPDGQEAVVKVVSLEVPVPNELAAKA